ncbi:hypothetical protein AX15_001012 [Amanita polypyramis BW_CC]|nr:hypothetical protein AX15_001012 [Amanita polypyramis BW_CC]
MASKKPTSTRKKRVMSHEPDIGGCSEIKAEPLQAKAVAEENEKSDSELSIMIDEPPKKRKSSKPESKSTGRGSTRKRKSPEPLSKDEETIKRLKSLVVACGVRKAWSKVFEGMNKPSQQIRKLKEILSDLGMKGRHSLEQAKAIREKRELAQELEDVQSFEKAVVGEKRQAPQSDSEDDESSGPKRRRVLHSTVCFEAMLMCDFCSTDTKCPSEYYGIFARPKRVGMTTLCEAEINVTYNQGNQNLIYSQVGRVIRPQLEFVLVCNIRILDKPTVSPH